MLLRSISWLFLYARNPSFRSDVFPIIRDNCLACHSDQTKMGQLVMESYDGLMLGGKRRTRDYRR